MCNLCTILFSYIFFFYTVYLKNVFAIEIYAIQYCNLTKQIYSLDKIRSAPTFSNRCVVYDKCILNVNMFWKNHKKNSR